MRVRECRGVPSMAHYIGVFLPLESGGWRALVPDVPDCEAEAASLDIAVLHVFTALAHAAVGLNGAIRPAAVFDPTTIPRMSSVSAARLSPGLAALRCGEAACPQCC